MEGIGRIGDFPNGVRERVEDTRAIGSLNFGIKIEQNHQAKNTNQEKKILTLFPTSYLLKQGPKGKKNDSSGSPFDVLFCIAYNLNSFVFWRLQSVGLGMDCRYSLSTLIRSGADRAILNLAREWPMIAVSSTST